MTRKNAFRIIEEANRWAGMALGRGHANGCGVSFGCLGDVLAAGLVGGRLYEVAAAVRASSWANMYGSGTNRNDVGAACVLAWWDRGRRR